MASTAAPSASFFLPRPIQRLAASAPASLTRTSSSARLRSKLVSGRLSMADSPSQPGSIRIKAGGSSTAGSAAMASAAARMACSRTSCVTSTTGTDSPGLRPCCSSDSSETPLVAQDGGDVGDHAGPVDHHQAEVVGAEMLADRHHRVVGRASWPQTGVSAAAREVDQVGHHGRLAVGPAPAPRPSSITRPTASPSATTALNTPSTRAIGAAAGTRQGARGSRPPPRCGGRCRAA